MTTPYIDSCVPISVFMLFDTAAFEAKRNSLALLVKSFFDSVAVSYVREAKKFMHIMVVIDLQSQSALTECQFLKSRKMAVHELGTEQTFQVLRASLTVQMYALINGQIRRLFFHIYREGSFTITLLIGARFL